MKNILHVNNTMNIGGVESFLLTTYSNIERKNYKFYFLCYSNNKFDYEDEIKKLGGEFIRISNPKKVSIIKHYHELCKIMKKYKFDVVCSHTYFDSAIVLLAALKSKIKIRIAHSHTTEGNNSVNALRRFKWNIARLIINICANYKFACSKEAGISLFRNKKFIVIPNGIDTKNFKFNLKNRVDIRNQYNIKEQDILIGHVGRFDKAKNHKFMIDLLEKLRLNNKSYKLMLVGNGKEYDDIISYVKEKNLETQVIFVGSVNQASSYYSAFDLFIFPSLYEGLGISLIEAQISGLKAIASTNVPQEVNETGNVSFLPLSINEWSTYINSIDLTRNDTKEYIEKSKYNIKNTIEILTKIYNK